MKALADCHLYTFIDFTYMRDRHPEDVAQQLIEGGSDIIQLRAKNLLPREIRRVAERILPILRRAGIPLVINDYPDIALQTGADYCHLGQEDFFEAGHNQVSELVPLEAVQKMGLSSHSPDQAKRAVEAGAVYLGVGPVFATPTKPDAPPATLDYVRWAARRLALPWFAIGGINLDNLDKVLEAGARRICVVSAILNAPDMVKACQDFKKRLVSAAQFEAINI